MTHAAQRRWLRHWTALLAVLASFAYLTRQPENLAGALSLPALAGMDMSGMEEGGMPGHSHHVPPSPASQHGHAAHCPFCFSTSFALEAQAFVLALNLVAPITFADAAYLAPHLLAARHAKARAPPVFQT